LNQARIILSSKNEFLRANGEKLVEDIKVTCKDWTKSSLKYLPNILNVIINEAVYSHHPESIESLL
jgi:fibrillarin-like rRNA methylase